MRFVRGRQLYGELAERSASNAREFLRDSARLRKGGSRGHSCALSILAIEEAAKGYLYKLAAEGVYRIVSRGPNNISTFSESQLFDHKFKHAVVARLLVGQVNYYPARRVLEGVRRKSFTRKQVELVVARVLHEQQLQSIRLRPGGKAAESLKKVFEALEGMNSLKNDSLYVGRRNNRPRSPNDLSRGELAEVQGLAAAIVHSVSEIVRGPIEPSLRGLLVEGVREIAVELSATSSKRKAVQASP